jgi:dTDP-4-dehydrorhamnose 3,5-epimerase
MKFLSTAIPEVVIVEPQVFGDSRGFFMESWQKRKFAEGGIDADFVQDNHSASTQWILRGLHYQLDKPQGKLVRVTLGAVYDVVVDLRKSSPTFGRWIGVELSAENKRMLWVPPGFAHGFLSLSERVEFLYKCTEYYFPADERAIAWNDRTLDIAWPLPADVTPTLSAKDAKGVSFDAAEKYP